MRPTDPTPRPAVSALGSGTLTLNGGTLAAGPAGGSVAGLVQAGSGPHTIAPGAGLASGFGTLNLNGGLSTNANTTLAFNVDLAPEISGIYVGDLINLGGSALTGSGGSIAFVGASPTTLADYRLIARRAAPEPDRFQPASRPLRQQRRFSLSTSVRPGQSRPGRGQCGDVLRLGDLGRHRRQCGVEQFRQLER